MSETNKQRPQRPKKAPKRPPADKQIREEQTTRKGGQRRGDNLKR